MKLDILANSYVGKVSRMLLRDCRDRPQLIGSQDPIRQTDAHHEVRSGNAFSTLAAEGSSAVALGVDAPPFEVHVGPFRRDAGSALPRELEDLFNVIPGIERPLESLNFLGLGFDRLAGCSHCILNSGPGKTKSPSGADGLRRLIGSSLKVQECTSTHELRLRVTTTTGARDGEAIHERRKPT
jgi:hypothetical protein